MAYATVANVEAGFRSFDTTETAICTALLDEAAIIIDAFNEDAETDSKKLVTCRMIRRAMGTGEDSVTYPLGSTQGSMSAGGYTQSWTIGSGSSGELYISKLEKQILWKGHKRIGSYSPVEG